MYWITVAEVLPPENRFITIRERRSIFKLFKLQQKSFAVWTPVRKLLMSMILVLLSEYPRLQILGLLTLSNTQLALMLHYQPFKRSIQNRIKVVCEITFLLA